MINECEWRKIYCLLFTPKIQISRLYTDITYYYYYIHQYFLVYYNITFLLSILQFLCIYLFILDNILLTQLY